MSAELLQVSRIVPEHEWTARSSGKRCLRPPERDCITSLFIICQTESGEEPVGFWIPAQAARTRRRAPDQSFTLMRASIASDIFTRGQENTWCTLTTCKSPAAARCAAGRRKSARGRQVHLLVSRAARPGRPARKLRTSPAFRGYSAVRLGDCPSRANSHA